MATSESETSGKPKMTREKRGVPGGLWLRCDDCGETIFRKEAEKLMSVCPQCGYHMYLTHRSEFAGCSTKGPSKNGMRPLADRSARLSR